MIAPTEIGPTEVHTVLRNAREAIVQYGWTRNSYTDEAGCLCLIGALCMSTTEPPRVNVGVPPDFPRIGRIALFELDKALTGETPISNNWWAAHQRLADWNDRAETAKTDVLNLYDRAIANVAREGLATESDQWGCAL